MRNKRGFTLIELLAVIVILAIIALIAVPIILNMIQNARKAAAVDTAYGYVDAVEYSIGLSDMGVSKYENINIKDQHYELDNPDLANIKVKGKKPDSGEMTIEKRRVKSGTFCIDGYTVEYNGKEAKISKKNTCKGGSSDEDETVQDKKACELESETKDSKTIYYIDSVEDMYAFAASVNGGNSYSGKIVKIRNNLDFSNYTPAKKSKVCNSGDNANGFTPIGTSSNPFSGTFEGNAKTIKNLTINRPNEDYVGIFGFTANATVQGLIVENANITGRNNVGTIIGQSTPSIIDKIVIKSSNVKGNSVVSGVSNLPAYSGNEAHNIIIKDIKVEATSTANLIGTGYSSFYNNVVVEKGTAIGVSSGFICDASANQDTYRIYYTSDAKVNDSTVNSACLAGKNDVKDINFYEAIGFDTWIGGTNTNYYFDYESSKSNSVTLKSSDKLPASIDDALEKSGDYYLIKDTDDWKKATAFVQDNKKFKLANDIDFSGKQFYMFGSLNSKFNGTFEGNANTISNASIIASKANGIGLFGSTQNATIMGLNVEGVNFLGNSKVASVVGSAAPGYLNEIVVKSATVKGNSYVGGFANIEPISGAESRNIIVKNVTVEGSSSASVLGSGYYSMFYNIVVEKGNVTAPSAGFTCDSNNGTYYKVYYSPDVKANSNNVGAACLASKASIQDINFLESIGMDTWIGGDNNIRDDNAYKSGYYFDYESDSSKNIVLKSTEKSPIPTDINDTFEKSGNYYLIKNENDWKKMSVFVNTFEKFKLVNNLNFASKNYYMLGSDQNRFKSTFNGGAKTIKNVTINANKSNYIGLFGYVSSWNQNGDDSVIYGFNVDNINVTGQSYVGGIVGYAAPANVYEVTINNSEVNGNTYVGAITGYLPYISGVEVSNILVKNVTVNAENYPTTAGIGYPNFHNIIVEKGTLNGPNASYTSGTNVYHSNLVKANDSTNTGGFSSDKINDLTYYSGKIETVLNGDSNNTGYYFDNDLDKGGIYLVEKTQQLGWKLLTSKTPKENQKWSYYQSANTRITDGWGRSITDLSGQLQDYYFENGIAIKGWKQIEGNWYYFSETDADKNGYIDFNKVYGGDITIGNRTCTFNSSGVCTSCSSGSCGS